MHIDVGLTNTLTDYLTSHAVSSIDAADRFSEPFPHIFFRDFFPDDFYKDLIKTVPDQGYEPITVTRSAFRLYGDNIGKIDPGIRPMWAAVSEMLASDKLKSAIQRVLREGLVIRARGDNIGNVDDLKLVAKPVIYKDRDGYEIRPHPDTRKKVVTMQVYCPGGDDRSELGTTLYKASLKGIFHPKSFGLVPVKTFPFLPNVGYAFVVLKANHSPFKMSWHGRPAISTGGTEPRVSILNTFYVSEDAGL